MVAQGGVVRIEFNRTRVHWLTMVLGLLGASAYGQTTPTSSQPAVPIDPVTGIIDAFKTHRIVALGEGDHGNEQGHAVRLALVRDPRFAAAVNDIVVEFGNSLYQDVMDRYVDDQDVPYAEVKKVWQNTTQAHPIWDRPIYEEFFRAVREVNEKLPKEKRLRVLLGDPAIDWNQIHTADDLNKIRRSDTVPAAIIEREVIAKNRRALIVYGDSHYDRKNLYWMLQDKAAAEERFARPVNSIVTILERGGTKVFSINTTFADLPQLQPDIATWNAPKLTTLAGTTLGVASYRFFYPHDVYIRRQDNTWEKVSSDPARSPLMQEQFEAILYLGPKASITYSKLSPTLCSDREYMDMRLGRMAIYSVPRADDDRAKLIEYCAKSREE